MLTPALGFGSLARADSSTALVLTRVSGPSPYAGCPANTSEVNYPNAAVEPRVAANPRTLETGNGNLVGVWQQDRWADGGARGLVAGYSFDGGHTWSETPLPFSTCAPGGLSYDAASDPWVSFGPDGTAYIAAIVLDKFDPALLRQGIATATSMDGGRTWNNVRMVTVDNCCELSDKESITADPAKAGVAYLVWDRSGNQPGVQTEPAWFSRTIDGGKTWSRPKIIAGRGQQTLGNEIVVDPRRHTLYDFFSREYRQSCARSGRRRVKCLSRSVIDDMAMVKSTDGGSTWSAARVIARDLSIGEGSRIKAQLRSGAHLPDAALDPTNGKLFVVWQDARFNGGRYDGIALASSRDGGNHWSEPRRVNRATGWPAVTPTIAVNAAGTVGVTYYDFRNPSKDPFTLATDYWLASSEDDGATYRKETHLAGPFNMLAAPWSKGFFLGDYQGLAAIGRSFQPFFVLTNSNDLSNRTDVFTMTVPG